VLGAVSVKHAEPGVVVHTSNPSTSEAETGGLQVQGQTMLHSETLSQKSSKRVGAKKNNPQEK
jgi:hypothetical protein